MELTVWAAYAAATFIVIVIPGPTVLLAVAYALKEGRGAGLAVTVGVALGDLVAMTAAMLGLGALLTASATAFTVLKLIGAAYLIYLGVKLLRSAAEQPLLGDAEHAEAGRSSWAVICWNAFAVTVTNPKSILFFVAFAPQFLDPAADSAPQFAVMIATFVTFGALNAATYAYLAGSVSDYASKPQNMLWVNRIGGGSLIGLGALAAAAQRP